MRSFFTTIAALVTTATFALSAEAWTTDYEAAKTRAKAENKPIFLYFTGSDWCGWCKKMEKEILTNKDFLDYATANLILVELDFPKSDEGKAKQSAELKAQNKALDKQFKIEGYPTIYLVDATGEQLPGTGDLAVDENTKDGPAGFAKAIQAALTPKKSE
jgi:protein disulfide-isomerase